MNSLIPNDLVNQISNPLKYFASQKSFVSNDLALMEDYPESFSIEPFQRNSV